MTTAPVKVALPVIPERFRARDVVIFSVIGLTLFTAMFAFMFSLSNM
jgi:hypothetical protein